MRSSLKTPFCWKCKTKGHTIEVCTAILWCEICKIDSHNTERCQRARGEKPVAQTAGFAVDALGFIISPNLGWLSLRWLVDLLHHSRWPLSCQASF